MRRLALLCSLWMACSGKSAIIVEVTQGVDVPPLDRLTVRIGGQLGPDAGAAVWIADFEAFVDVNVTGRDLVADPYRLSIENGLENNGPVMGVVLGYSAGGTQLAAFAGVGPQAFIPGETILVRVVLNPRANVFPLATGCVFWFDNGERKWIGAPDDHDCDGYTPPDDCDDFNFRVNPAVTERCNNGIDDNCNMDTDETVDVDQDTYTNCDNDCNDNDPDVHPGALEICDGKDNDCNNICDGEFDGDGDKVTTCGTEILTDGTCTNLGQPDCNDAEAEVHPGHAEACDGKDNNCDGVCDDLLEFDKDHDGFTTCGTVAAAPAVQGICGKPLPAFTDCDDDDDTVHPFGHEVCDGKDNTCDGTRETSEPCFGLESTTCRIGTRACVDLPADAGAGGLQPGCAPDLAVSYVMDPALCAAYTSCEGNLEPYVCAARGAALASFTCDLAFRLIPGTADTPTTTELCPNAKVNLPSFGQTTGCVWLIPGGVQQELYSVNLESLVGVPGPLLMDCEGLFMVQSAVHPIVGPAVVVIVYGDAVRENRTTVVYGLAPKLVSTCPASALSCIMN